MKNKIHSVISYGFLSVLLVSLVLTLTGCGWFNQAPEAEITTTPSSSDGALTASVGEEITFSGGESEDPDGSITSYEWDLDDGNSGSGESLTHSYSSTGTYTVTLEVTDDGGATDSASVTVEVTTENEPPSASFTLDPTSGTVPLQVEFDASGSNDPDGTLESYEWDFGDGDTGSGQTVTHTYENTGSFTVQLTVTDDSGATDSTTYSVNVSPQENDSPVAEFTADPESGDAPLDVSFDASGSYDPDGSIESYEWDFDDGETATGETVSHEFDSEGSYEVTLTVTDDDGASDVESVTIEVSTSSDGPPPPP